MGSPFLLSEEDQDEENRRQLEAFGNSRPAPTPQPRGLAPQNPMAKSVVRRPQESLEATMNPGHTFTYVDPNHLGNMTGAVNKAISDEMESRVAQAREQRRMQHERELMQMKLEAASREQEGQMIRDLLNGR